MTRAEFIACTPREFEVLHKQRTRLQKETEVLLAQLAALTVNFSMVRPEKPMKASDFYLADPSLPPPKQKRRTQQQIAEELVRAFGVMHQRLGGNAVKYMKRQPDGSHKEMTAEESAAFLRERAALNVMKEGAK